MAGKMLSSKNGQCEPATGPGLLVGKTLSKGVAENVQQAVLISLRDPTRSFPPISGDVSLTLGVSLW